MIGSGNFGSALVRILGRNAMRHDMFDDEVRMYVHEEIVQHEGVDTPLTEVINKTNENVKYLAGAKFTPNVVAVPDITKACEGATMIGFCIPHQFLKPMIPAITVRHARPAWRGGGGGEARWVCQVVDPPLVPLDPLEGPAAQQPRDLHLLPCLTESRPLRRRPLRRPAPSASLQSRALTSTTRASC